MKIPTLSCHRLRQVVFSTVLALPAAIVASAATPPVIIAPVHVTAEATGPSGAVVSFAVSATDAVGVQIFSSDFESPSIPANSYQVVAGSPPPATAALGGWNFTGSGGLLNGNGGGYGSPVPPQGNQAAFIQHPQEGWLSQMESATTFPLVAGQTYTVDFYQAARNYGPLTYDVTINGNGGRTEIFRRTTVSGEGWAPYVATFVASASGDYTVAFNVVSTPNPTDDATFFIDDVQVYSTTVPVIASPASGSTFALGNTTVTVTATNAAGLTSTGSFTVTVSDTTPPEFSALTIATVKPKGDRDEGRWLKLAATATVADLVDLSPVTRITTVTYVDTLKSKKHGDKDDDQKRSSSPFVITGNLTLKIRRELPENISSRTYTITVTSTDKSGNVSARSVTYTQAKNSDDGNNDADAHHNDASENSHRGG